MVAASLVQASLALSKVSLYWPSGERRWNTPAVVSRRGRRGIVQASPPGWPCFHQRFSKWKADRIPGFLGMPLPFEMSFKILISFLTTKVARVW